MPLVMTCSQVSTSISLMRATDSSSQSMPSVDLSADGSNVTASRMSPNSAHRAGFRDCGLAALDYLTNVARLDPNEAVVVGVKRLVERGSAAPTYRRRRRRIRPIAAAAVDCRRPRTTVDQENRRPTATTAHDATTHANSPATTTTCGFRSHINTALPNNVTVHGHGRVALGENRLILSCVSPAKCSSSYESRCHTSDETTTVDVEPMTLRSPFDGNRNRTDFRRRPQSERHSTKLDSDVSRLSAGEHLSIRPETLFRDGETSAVSTVVECARILDGLARRDSRVENLLTEIMDLMDEESDESIEL